MSDIGLNPDYNQYIHVPCLKLQRSRSELGLPWGSGRRTGRSDCVWRTQSTGKFVGSEKHEPTQTCSRRRGQWSTFHSLVNSSFRQYVFERQDDTRSSVHMSPWQAMMMVQKHPSHQTEATTFSRLQFSKSRTHSTSSQTDEGAYLFVRRPTSQTAH